jgi:hypothetical protein
MNIAVPQLNLVFAWVWILAGFISGMILGLKFQDEKWLGGYASFKRRMHRLAHISFFGLGAVNLFFHLSLKGQGVVSTLGTIASAAFIVGGISMPICCWTMAVDKRFQALFAIPVASLICGAILTIAEITR